MNENQKLLYYSRFLQALIENKSAQEIIDIGFELLGNPIMLIDNDYKLIAYTHNIDVADPNWYHTQNSEYIALEIITSNDKFIQARKSKRPIRYRERSRNFEAIYASVLLDNKLIAYIVTPDHLKQFCDDDLEIVELIKDVLALHFQKGKIRTLNQMNKSLFTDLLDGKIKDNDTVEARCRRFQWVLHGNYYVLTVKSGGSFDEGALEQIGESVQKMVADSKYTIYREVVVVLITRKKRDFPGSNHEELVGYLKNNNLCAGISNCFHSLIDTSEQYNLALLASELGIKAEPDKVLYFYEDYLLHHILSVCTDQINLNAICPEALLSLAKSSGNSREDLVNCLYEYLRNDRNIQKTANVLGIHRNTLTYRIKKIRDILEMDIEDEDVAFNLLLAVKIMRYGNNTVKDPDAQ